MRPKFFTQSEVTVHNTAEDLWVSFLGQVLDLTPLAQRHKGDHLLLPLLENAGKDISHWFDPGTKDVLQLMDPVTNLRRYYTPRGRFLDVPPPGPRSDWACDLSAPWWKDTRYRVGLLSKKTRFIRIINTLTSQEQRLEVCSEETLKEICDRYRGYNAHADSYTWKHLEKVLEMNRTLEENGLHDDDQEVLGLGLDPDESTLSLLLYFNDDLTEG